MTPNPTTIDLLWQLLLTVAAGVLLWSLLVRLVLGESRTPETEQEDTR